MNPYDPVIYRRPPGRIGTLFPMFTLWSESRVILNPDEDNHVLEQFSWDDLCRKKLADWGFDPHRVSQGSRGWVYSEPQQLVRIGYGERNSRPMVFFAQLGDIDVMNYIWQQSSDPPAELGQTDDFGLFPLYSAISEPHEEQDILQTCRWLVQKGANVRQTVAGEWSPLSRACLKGMPQVATWLVVSGALLTRSGRFDVQLAQRDLPARGKYVTCGGGDKSLNTIARGVHQELFSWAKETIESRDTFFLVLVGVTCFRPSASRVSNEPSMDIADDENLKASEEKQNQSPLVMLNGFPGILELIASFVGVETKRSVLTTAQGLMDHESWWEN